MLAVDHMFAMSAEDNDKFRKIMFVKLVFLLRITLDQAQGKTFVRKIFRFG